MNYDKKRELFTKIENEKDPIQKAKLLKEFNEMVPMQQEDNKSWEETRDEEIQATQ